MPQTLLCLLSISLIGLLSPLPAGADVGITKLSTTSAEPGQRVSVEIGCGNCPVGNRFPVSLVPVKRAPQPFRCGPKRLCYRSTATPPRQHPFTFLGVTEPGRSADRFAGTESRLRFRLPELAPGRYAFVIFCEGCHPGPRGSLIAETHDPGSLLQVRASSQARIGAGAAG